MEMCIHTSVHACTLTHMCVVRGVPVHNVRADGGGDVVDNVVMNGCATLLSLLHVLLVLFFVGHRSV